MRHSIDEIQKIVSAGKPYWFVELKSGPHHSQDEEAERSLQMEHLDHLFSLKKDGKILLAGPTPKAQHLRGICIFDGTLSKDEVESLVSNDPSVKQGRLIFTVNDFFGIPGDQLV